MKAETKSLINWNPEFSVGVQKLDEQHKVLIDLINRLHQTVVSNQMNSTAATAIVNELIRYVGTHFVFEEGLMQTFHYPAYAEHKKHHDEFSKKVSELQGKAAKGEIAIGMQLWVLVRSWLTEHILLEDKKYSQFFVKHGL